MARFLVTPTNIKTGNVAPSSIHDFDENKDIEGQAENAIYLCKKFPNVWRPSSTKLNPCVVDIRGNFDKEVE